MRTFLMYTWTRKKLMVMYRGFKRERIGLSFYYFLYMNLLKDTFNTFREAKMLYVWDI